MMATTRMRQGSRRKSVSKLATAHAASAMAVFCSSKSQLYTIANASSTATAHTCTAQPATARMRCSRETGLGLSSPRTSSLTLRPTMSPRSSVNFLGVGTSAVSEAPVPLSTGDDGCALGTGASVMILGCAGASSTTSCTSSCEIAQGTTSAGGSVGWMGARGLGGGLGGRDPSGSPLAEGLDRRELSRKPLTPSSLGGVKRLGRSGGGGGLGGGLGSSSSWSTDSDSNRTRACR
mmetsp:Transcript_36534/g.90631  ORF Transcript_36534/g.90631 Transcript_36534/m.90631 type:complete len:235 (-) Transcript_36534:209-913(-)